MKRREIITLLGAAATWPLAARAQQSGRMARIGVLMGLPEGDPEGEKWARALLETLLQLGWIHDKNVRIDLRWGGTDPDRMQKLAKELIDLQPDVIEVTTTPATAAVLRQTRTIPVVFSIVSDPLGSGFVQSFVRPGGNATGFVNIEASVAGKWLALLKEVVPQASRARIIFNPKTAPQADYYLKLLAAAAPALTLTLDVVRVDSADRIAAAVNELAGQSNVGIVLIPDIFIGAKAQTDLIISLTTRHHIPTVYFAPYMVRDGGLISYGVDFSDLQRRAARYVDRVLKGANPQELPVQLPTRFELTVNLKTARALGLEIPATLLASADEVIE
jgi:putative tryptophan/tyrosine transport system substrate-binding protein